MLFLDYEILKIKYLDTQQGITQILNEKERLFAKTQPKSVQFDKERVSGGQQGNAFEDYMIEKERKQIDERLTEMKGLLAERRSLLKLKEEELRASKDVRDIIYCYRYLENVSGYEIAKLTNYSKSQIYRTLKEIDKKIGLNGKEGTKRDKMG